MARPKWICLLALVLMAGCSTGHPQPTQFQPQFLTRSQLDSPAYIGRSCVAKLLPDLTPDYTNGCTANDRLFFEQHYIR
jgi:hypothetical protein